MPTCFIEDLPYQADPTGYFNRILYAPGAVLLDSGQPEAQRGRYDIMSAWPLATLEASPDETAKAFFARLRRNLAELGPASSPANTDIPFCGGLIGYLSYDFGRRIEQLPACATRDLDLSDACFGLYAWALISDHQTQRSYLMFHPHMSDAEQARIKRCFSELQPLHANASFMLSSPFAANITEPEYQAGLARILAYIAAGDCYQVNFAQRFQATYQGEPWGAYTALRKACPTPFSAFIRLSGNNAILSLSPERFIRVSKRQVETRPIKGTRPRGQDARHDKLLADELLNSPKDRAENLMIVDLLRNDLGRNCKIGSVKVPELFALESYPNVHHLVSAVTGELATERDPLDLLAGSFPGGSITGAPKIRAMEIIDELEPARRSIYCGSVLYLDVRGEMDSSIAIRSLLAQDGQISCWGGGGIVADSEAQAEYQESITKVKVLLNTLETLGKH